MVANVFKVRCLPIVSKSPARNDEQPVGAKSGFVHVGQLPGGDGGIGEMLVQSRILWKASDVLDGCSLPLKSRIGVTFEWKRSGRAPAVAAPGQQTDEGHRQVQRETHWSSESHADRDDRRQHEPPASTA